MNVLELFAGIGGMSLGLERAGFEVVGQVEIDPFCRAVLSQHWPEVPRHDDVRTAVEWWLSEPRPRVDVVVGGYPCQPESTAGRRRGTDDERWLWPEFARVVDAVRPRYVIGENVMGHRTSGLRFVLRDLDRLGYAARAGVVSAEEMGAPHRRQRIFVLAVADGEAGRSETGHAVAGIGGAAPGVGPIESGRRGLGPDVADPGRTGRRPGWSGRGVESGQPAGEPWWTGVVALGRSWWAAEPDVGRVAHGVPGRVDRLRTLGNAVVPQVAEFVGRLLHSGAWLGVLPLPAGAKWPPPVGFTGWAGVEPSGADVQAWCDGPQAAGNIALHLPAGLYGLDVDDYGAKTGGAALGRLVEALGPLPATWIVSSREESVSGIRLFRAALPLARRWRNEPAGHGAGIEAIHRGHRYAVVAPSTHPETGRKYGWRRPDGLAAGDDELPRPDDLPELPAAWVEALSEPGETRTGDIAGHDETIEVVGRWREGEPCTRMREAGARAVRELARAAQGAPLHPAIITVTHELVSLGHEGHVGARRALADTYVPFTDVRTARGEDRGAAEAEWWRAVRGAVGKLRASDAREQCDCELRSGAGLLFEPDPEPWPSVVDGPSSSISDQTDREYSSSDMPELDLADAMLTELLSAVDVAGLPNPTPVVSGLLYADTLSWLIGRSGSFKSFIALDLAAHVAAGSRWAGRRTARGGVLYLAAEGGGGMGLRVRAWTRLKGEMDGPLRFLRRPIQARGPEWAVLVEMVRRNRPLLIVVDTQARVTVGIKENDNTEMGQFIEQVDQLRRAARSCVLLVHHIGRNGDDARGASAIDGAQDTELKVERLGGPKSLRARLVIDKQKDGPDTDQIEFEMTPVELGIDPDTDEPVTSLVAVAREFIEPFPVAPWNEDMPERLGRIMSVLHEQFSESGGTAASVLTILRERGWTKEYPKTTFYRCWNELQRTDRIVRVAGTQRWLIPESGELNV